MSDIDIEVVDASVNIILQPPPASPGTAQVDAYLNVINASALGIELQPVPGAGAVPPAIEVALAQGVPGPQGPAGVAGPVGPAGPPLFYEHLQQVPSNVWTVNHNLGVKPAVQLFDSAGDEIEGTLEHLSSNSLQVTFGVPVSGVAYLT